MADKLYWQIYRQKTTSMSEFEDVVIELFPWMDKRRKGGPDHNMTVLDDATRSGENVELRWQTDKKDWSALYAFHLELRLTSLSRLSDANRAVRRVLRDIVEYGDPTAEDVIERLGNLRPPAERVIYDGRLSAYVPIARVLPSQIHRFIDDWRGVPGHGGRGCTASALAHVNDGAADKVEADFRRARGSRHSYWRDSTEEYFQAWLKAGRPVRDASTGGYTSEIPTVKSVRQILAGK